MELLQDTQIWVLISFVIFAFFAYKYGKDKFLALLDNRIEEIRKEIESAESLRVEAQELLAQYQRKQRDAATEAEVIIKAARESAKAIHKKANADLEDTIQRREQQLQDRLQRMEKATIQEIQAYAADLAVKATREIIAEKMDRETSDRLVEDAIKNVAGPLN